MVHEKSEEHTPDLNEAPAGDAAASAGVDTNADLPGLGEAAEVNELRERLLRLQAEYDNYRKRALREREETVLYANLNLVRDFLPVLDNLERAVSAAEAAAADAVKSGIEMIIRQFQEVLERAGVTAVPALDQPFNPEIHEAVLQADGDYEVPTVIEEFQKGYRMGQRLVRPSMVKVASGQ